MIFRIAVLFLPLLAIQCRAASPGQLRSAANRAIAVVQAGAAGFYKHQDCFSCHDHALPMMAFRMARERGVEVDESAANQVAAKGLLSSPNLASVDRAVQDPTIVDVSMSEGWALVAADAAGVRPNAITAIYARRVANAQLPDGHWATIDARPPQSYSRFTATAIAMLAIQLHMPARLHKETDERLARGQAWLLKTEPLDTEDTTSRLFGLYWAAASASEIRAARRSLLALQHPDGGWSQLPDLPSDAYSTGQALVALREAGRVPIVNTSWQKGLNYLLATQQDDGSWHVHTRMLSPAAVSPPYFETGFPYGHDQFISKDSTCWAAMAIMSAMPRRYVTAKPPALPDLEPVGLMPWMEPLLSGTAEQLKEQLDAGLDPNRKTPDGTTMLMMAATDSRKVELLIAHGADVNATAKTGFTALMAAATNSGTSESVKLLLAAGAEVRPGTRVLFNASPLFLAVLSGDRENVELLLAHGADPKRKMNVAGTFPASTLVAAASQSDPGILQALLTAGADINEKDPDEMTPLHWAVLAHRAGSVKVLLDRKADVNAADRFGYTPLHYAATVDFGDADIAQMLLEAGADPRLTNKEGKTALVQAGNFPRLRAVLEQAAVPK